MTIAIELHGLGYTIPQIQELVNANIIPEEISNTLIDKLKYCKENNTRVIIYNKRKSIERLITLFTIFTEMQFHNYYTESIIEQYMKFRRVIITLPRDLDLQTLNL